MIQHISYLSERVNCHQSQHPAAGAWMGLGSRTKGPVHFSRLPHPPQQRPCLRRHHRDNPPTQGAKGDANRHSAQSEEMEDAELSSYQPLWLEGGGFYEGTFGGKRGPKKKKTPGKDGPWEWASLVHLAICLPKPNHHLEFPLHKNVNIWPWS